ncbi:MAG: DinB family protein [Anaerolineae bacterium]|nr:DinB family protein [Anaerolineae bacterium]
MNTLYFVRLFDYTYWAHRRLWHCVMQLSAEQFSRPSSYSIGSVHQQIVHTLGAEEVWLPRIHGTSPSSFPQPADLPTRTDIRLRWDAIEKDWRRYLDRLEDTDLEKPVTFRLIKDTSERTAVLSDILGHVANHSTDHRAQILALIHALGGETAEQDFIIYSREHSLL